MKKDPSPTAQDDTEVYVILNGVKNLELSKKRGKENEKYDTYY